MSPVVSNWVLEYSIIICAGLLALVSAHSGNIYQAKHNLTPLTCADPAILPPELLALGIEIVKRKKNRGSMVL